MIRAGKIIPVVMGASKEAYNLFGPEVNIVTILDDGWVGGFDYDVASGFFHPCGGL